MYEGIIFVLSLVIVIMLYLIVRKSKKRDGVLIVNLSDPEKDVFTLEFETGLEEVPNKKRIIFEVVSQ